MRFRFKNHTNFSKKPRFIYVNSIKTEIHGLVNYPRSTRIETDTNIICKMTVKEMHSHAEFHYSSCLKTIYDFQNHTLAVSRGLSTILNDITSGLGGNPKLISGSLFYLFHSRGREQRTQGTVERQKLCIRGW